MLSSRFKTSEEEQSCLGCRSESAQHFEYRDVIHEDKTGMKTIGCEYRRESDFSLGNR